MDALMKQSREAQGMLVGTALFIILSFFGWQAASIDLGSFGTHSVSFSLWHSFYGVIIALIAILLFAWELMRALDVKIDALSGVEPGVVSTALAFALGILTVILFLDWSQIRAWPEYVGTLLAIGIAILAFLRARNEGVGMPAMPSGISVGGGGTATTSSPAAPPPSAPAYPAPPAPPASAPAPLVDPSAAPIVDPFPERAADPDPLSDPGPSADEGAHADPTPEPTTDPAAEA